MNAVTNNIEELRALTPPTTTTNVTLVNAGPVRALPATTKLTVSTAQTCGAWATGLFDLRGLSHDPASELLRDRFLCRGTEHREDCEPNWSIDRGNDPLWYSAMTDHPDVIATQMAQWRAVR